MIILNVLFSHHSNILDEFSYMLGNGNEKLIKLSNSIIEYFNLENEFINNIPLKTNFDNKLNINDEYKTNMDNKYYPICDDKLNRENNIKYNLFKDKYKLPNYEKKRNISYDKFEKIKISEQNNIKSLNKIDYNSNKIREGYLVNENWIIEWIKFSNYYNIIKGYSYPINEKYEEIAEKLYLYLKNNNENKKLSPIELLHFNSKIEYENYIKYNNLVIINDKFYKLFSKIDYNNYVNNNYKIKYSFEEEIIKIYLNDIQLNFISTKNIILNKIISDLKILKYIKEFQDELISNKNFKQKFNKIAMIEKNWIKEMKNKYLYKEFSNEIKNINFRNINFYNLSKAYQNKLKEIKNKNEFNIKSKQKLEIINKNIPNNKQIKYISDFEIVSMETITLLKILYNDFSNYYYEGELYISDAQYSNIIICFQDSDNNNNYQIGKIVNNIFITNYTFNFNKNISSSFLIKYIFNSRQKEEEFFNKIYYNNNTFFINKDIPITSFKLKFSDDFDCLKILFFSINIFEKEINNKIMNKGKIYSYENCYLINKKCLKEFKEIFLYNDYIKDKKLFINNKQKLFDIFSDKKKFEKIFEKQNDLNIESYITIKNYTFYYPCNFDIIDEKIYNNLNDLAKFLNINISENIFRKTPLIINDKKIIIKLMHYNLLIIKIDKNFEFISRTILAFDKYSSRDNFFKQFKLNKFKEILFDKVISFIYSDKNEIIGKQYLLSKMPNELNIKKEEIIKNYLKIIIEFFKINEYIMNKKSKIITLTPTINEEEFFIVNQKWVDEFKYIFSYDEIINTLTDNKDFIINEKENIDKIIDLIYKKISDLSKKYLNNLNENIISMKFNNKNLYEIFQKYNLGENKFLTYFEKCAIINSQIIDLLKIKNKIQKISCFFGDNKILLRKESFMGIGNLKNNLFITEYFINLNNQEDLELIKYIIEIKGFDYINELLQKNMLLNIKINDIKVITKVNNLVFMKYDDSNLKNFDEKLKVLLILCIYQLKFKERINDNNKYLNNIFLLNSDFLSKLYYDNLYNTISNIIEINNEIKKDIESNKIKEKEILFNLSKYLNIKIILDIENNLKEINSENLINLSLFSKKINILLTDKKNINIYDNFIILDKNIVTLIRDTFNVNIINLDEINISHISLNQKNIIIINDCKKINVLLGNIINNGNYYKLEYIFDYNDEAIIKSELNKIVNNYDKYFKNNLLYNDKYQNDFISPIFSEKGKDIIGYCYKYNRDIILNNFTKYSINNNLNNIIQIYIYESILTNILIKKEICTLLDEYYLVNINFLKEYKINYKYNEIKKELISNKDNILIIKDIYKDLLNNNKKIYQTKSFYLLLKAINPNINIKFNDLKIEEKLSEKNINPSIIEMEYYDNNSKEKNIIKLDYNFELIHKNILELFIDKNKLEKNIITYDIINDYILINYPIGKNDNSQYITLVGNMNDEYIFVTYYILIYYSAENRYKHIKLLKKYLDNYLSGISLMNNNTPIINDKYEIIGVIIKNNNEIKDNKLNIEIEKSDNKKYRELELKYDEEKIKNKDLNNKIEELKNSLTKENNINKDLNNKIEELKNSLNKEKNINKDLNDKIKEISNINSNKDFLLKEEISKYNNLKNKNDEVTKELKNIKINQKDLENKIQKLNSELGNEKYNNNILKSKNNELTKEIKNIKLNENVFQDKIKKLNNELENEKNKYINSKNEIIGLKESLDNKINLNNKLNETIISKESKLSENKVKLDELNQKVKFLENMIENNENDNKTKLINLFEELKLKENEIKEIQSRYPVILSKGEKLICVILLSMDQKIQYPVICKSNDKFTKIEELLYEEFPEYSESENIFLVNGRKINRFKNMEFNRIKYGDIITFYQENNSFEK